MPVWMDNCYYVYLLPSMEFEKLDGAQRTVTLPAIWGCHLPCSSWAKKETWMLGAWGAGASCLEHILIHQLWFPATSLPGCFWFAGLLRCSAYQWKSTLYLICYVKNPAIWLRDENFASRVWVVWIGEECIPPQDCVSTRGGNWDAWLL